VEANLSGRGLDVIRKPWFPVYWAVLLSSTCLYVSAQLYCLPHVRASCLNYPLVQCTHGL